jgi:hypothetical protein
MHQWFFASQHLSYPGETAMHLPLHPAFLASLVFVSLHSQLSARDLLVDQRGGTAYPTLASAAAAALPGDILILAPGSGPYRETLAITASGQAGAPITVEGNGETITGFAPMVFTTTGGVSTHTLPAAFSGAPVVICWQGRRILQDQSTGAFLGPISLRSDGVTLELTAGTSTQGWEISSRDLAVSINNVSHHIYRNLHATGAKNDGFNLHGSGSDLIFENIAAHDNLDEGFSAHDTISATINGARFWDNDNGLTNVGSSQLTASNVRTHDNIGYGFFLSGSAQGTLTNVTSWNNGAGQIRFDSQTSGTCSQVSAWNAAWSTPPWCRYQESASVTTTGTLMGQATATSANWPSVPSVATIASPAAINPTATTPVPSVTSLIQSAASAGRPLVVLPAGLHTLSTDISLSNPANLEIDGTDATLVMTNTTHSVLRLLYANNVTVRGLTLTYDPLPYTQATITSVSSGFFGFTIQAGYPDINSSYVAADGSMPPTHLFNAQGNRHPQAYDFYQPQLTFTSARTGTAAGSWPATLAVGDQVAFDRRSVDRKNALELLWCSGPVTIEDVSVLASPSLSIAGRYCEDLVTLRRITIRPGDKPAGATAPRLLSGNADGFNFVQCRRGPLIENCDLSRMGDDSLNVHGHLFQVTEVVDADTFRFTWPTAGDAKFLVPCHTGDTIRLYSNADYSLGTTASFQNYSASTSGGVTTYTVNLTAPAAVEVGQYFDIPAVNCPGFVVRDSYFHDHRGRGLRVMADNGLIENNRFERITKSAVSVGPELAFWGEAGWVGNTTVRNNVLRDIGVDVSLAANGSYAPGAISVYVHGNPQTHPYPLENTGVSITGNVIDGSSVAGIHAYAARNLVITGNALRHTNLVRGAGTTDASTGLTTTGPISLDGLIDVTVSGNTALVTDTIDDYPVNTAFTTGQTLGSAGDGWSGGWRTGSSYSTTTGTVLSTVPVLSGQRLKLVVTTDAGHTSASGAIGRAYDASAIAGPYTVAFRYRPDGLPANMRSSLSDNQTRSSAASGTSTWRIDSINGTWQVFDGPASGGTNQFIDTGLPAGNAVPYDFTVTPDPATLTWSVTIASPSASVTRSGLHFRAASFGTDASEAPGGRWLTVAILETVTSGNTVGATGSASIDGIQVRVPSSAATSTAAYINESFETYPSGAAFTTGQTLGGAIDGWAYGWRTASAYSTTGGAISVTNILDAGHRLSASVATQAGQSYSGGAVTRPYAASRIAGPFDLSFRFRPDSASSNFGYVLCDTSMRTAVPNSSVTWQIAGVGGTWRVYDGAANGGTNAYIDTGLAVTPGIAYDFAITVNPAAHTWGVTISSSAGSVTRIGLNWRSASFATDTTEAVGGRWLNFSGQESLAGSTTTGATGTFSLDTLVLHAPLL